MIQFFSKLVALDAQASQVQWQSTLGLELNPVKYLPVNVTPLWLFFGAAWR